MAYIDQSGKVISLGRQLGRRGGEGIVFEAASHPGSVVKIYHEPADTAKAAKLRHLCELVNPSLLKFAAWPTSVVHDSQGKLRGLLMPMIDGKEVHQLFGPKERISQFPHAKWDFLVRVARNCAAAFDEVHSLGVIIGDVNEGNIMVKRDGIVCLIDCDSYQAQKNGYTWTCDVGVSHWTPPELQKKQFRGLQRSINHDVFGLAIMVFKLLFMGRHPFAGTLLGPGDLDLEKTITEYKFAFSERAAQYGMRPPPHSLPIETLPKNYRDLFERAFTPGSERDGARPTAREWALALDSFEKNLRECQTDKSHRIPSHISNCTWCSIWTKGGPHFFISFNTSLPQGKVIIQVWNDIDHVSMSGGPQYNLHNLPLLRCSPSPLPAPEKTIRAQFFWGLGMLLFAFFILAGGAISIGCGVGLIGCGLLYTGMYNYSYTALRKTRTDRYNKLSSDLQSKVTENEQLQNNYKQAFSAEKSDLRRQYDRLVSLDGEKKREIQGLEAKKRQIQLNAFLDKQLLLSADISGIGPKKRQILLAFGIESAYDVINARSVPGIGDVYFYKLITWRRSCEARFSFNPNQAIPAAELHPINVKFSNIARTLEGELGAGPGKLQHMNRKLALQRETLDRDIHELLRLFSQAKLDLETVPKG